METTLLEVGKKAVFPQFLKNPSDGIDVGLAWVFGVNEDVIEVNNDEDIKFLGHDLVNVALEASRGVDIQKALSGTQSGLIKSEKPSSIHGPLLSSSDGKHL